MEHWAGYNRTDGALGRLDDGSHGLTGPGLLTARCSCPGPGPARGDLAEIISRTFPASSRWPATTRCWPPTTRSREELLAARLAPHRPRLRRQARGAAGRRPDLPVYFVNTHSRLAKTGENTNGFIQKYILKGTKIPVSLEYQ